MSRTQAATAVFLSAECHTDLVQSLYSHFLHRNADPGGMSVFVAAMEHGISDETIILLLAASPEYVRKSL